MKQKDVSLKAKVRYWTVDFQSSERSGMMVRERAIVRATGVVEDLFVKDGAPTALVIRRDNGKIEYKFSDEVTLIKPPRMRWIRECPELSHHLVVGLTLEPPYRCHRCVIFKVKAIKQ